MSSTDIVVVGPEVDPETGELGQWAAAWRPARASHRADHGDADRGQCLGGLLAFDEDGERRAIEAIDLVQR